MSDASIVRIPESTHVDVLKSWYETVDPDTQMTATLAGQILEAVEDDGEISKEEMQSARDLVRTLNATRIALRDMIVAGELPETDENVAGLGRVKQNLELAKRLYADMFLTKNR